MQDVAGKERIVKTLKKKFSKKEEGYETHTQRTIE